MIFAERERETMWTRGTLDVERGAPERERERKREARVRWIGAAASVSVSRARGCPRLSL